MSYDITGQWPCFHRHTFVSGSFDPTVRLVSIEVFIGWRSTRVVQMSFADRRVKPYIFALRIGIPRIVDKFQQPVHSPGIEFDDIR